MLRILFFLLLFYPLIVESGVTRSNADFSQPEKTAIRYSLLEHGAEKYRLLSTLQKQKISLSEYKSKKIKLRGAAKRLYSEYRKKIKNEVISSEIKNDTAIVTIGLTFPLLPDVYSITRIHNHKMPSDWYIKVDDMLNSSDLKYHKVCKKYTYRLVRENNGWFIDGEISKSSGN